MNDSVVHSDKVLMYCTGCGGLFLKSHQDEELFHVLGERSCGRFRQVPAELQLKMFGRSRVFTR